VLNSAEGPLNFPVWIPIPLIQLWQEIIADLPAHLSTMHFVGSLQSVYKIWPREFSGKKILKKIDLFAKIIAKW
jgi:hypothetical protein